MFRTYFKSLYQRTMHEAYALAHAEIENALRDGGACLDCGANIGHKYDLLRQSIGLEQSRYHGIEWGADAVNAAREKGLRVTQGDLNKKMAFADETFACILGLSVLEHPLNPCHYLKESYRCLAEGERWSF